MAVKFSNCEVRINGDKILSQSVSISQSNSLSPIKTIGYKNPISNSPTGPLQNSVKFNYLLETNNEPNHFLSQYIILYNTHTPAELVVAGVVMTGYLTSYSLSIKENSPIEAAADYAVFHPINLNTSEESVTGYLGYNTSSSNNIGHYWTTSVRNSDDNQIAEIINLDYLFRANWKPIYSIGNTVPSQVSFLDGQESFKFNSEYDISIIHSGEYLNNNTLLNQCAKIKMNNLSYLWTDENVNSMSLYPSGGKVISHETLLSEDNLILSTTEIVKNF